LDDFAPPAYDVTEDQAGPARTAAVLALVGLGLQSTACCSSILGIGAGTVLGGIALFMARGVLLHEPEGEARAYANVAWWAGAFSAAWGAFVTVAIMAYVALYVVMIAVIVVSGN